MNSQVLDDGRFYNLFWGIIFALVFLLLNVWNMPGTIALRNLVMGLLLMATLGFCTLERQNKRAHGYVAWTPIVSFAILSGWLVLVVFGWSDDFLLSWNEFKGQWLSASLAGALGCVLAYAASIANPDRSAQLINVVFWSLFLQILFHDILGGLFWLETGVVPFRMAPVLHLQELANAESWHVIFMESGPDKFSYLNNMLAALVVADVTQRIVLRRPWLKCGVATLIAACVAVILCSFLLKMRNGNIGLILLLAFSIIAISIRVAGRIGAKKALIGYVSASAVVLTIAVLMINSDQRWQTFFKAVPIAWDTEKNRGWLHMETPEEIAGDSAYLRIAWIKEGIKLTLDKPWGSGYNRSAFGDRIDEKYHPEGGSRGGHSHSGVVDFAIANGFVGIFLYCIFLASIFKIGWVAFSRSNVALGVAIMCLVSGFFGRGILDSNIRDHMLQQFLFMAMLFCSLAGPSLKDR